MKIISFTGHEEEVPKANHSFFEVGTIIAAGLLAVGIVVGPQLWLESKISKMEKRKNKFMKEHDLRSDRELHFYNYMKERERLKEIAHKMKKA